MPEKYYVIDGESLTIEDSVRIVRGNISIKLSGSSKKHILASRKLVDEWIDKDKIIYGITTGFGEFKDVVIPKKDRIKLQRNLILSHSAGVGSYIPDHIVRLMLLFRINSLAK